MRWLGARERIDRLMEGLPASLSPAERSRCQHLVYGVVRHFGRLEAALEQRMAHLPRFETRAVLLLAAFELIDGERGGSADPGASAKIVHHAVERAKTLASPAEARLVNAVARKLAEALPAEAAPGPEAAPADLARFYSHPEWLVRRWIGQYGVADTRALLEWNQRPATLYARKRGQLDFLAPSDANRIGQSPAPSWPGFIEVPPGLWPEIEPKLKAGILYLQDPSTRLAVQVLAPQPGESVLDACAAPGGKSLMIADAMAGAGLLVALDLPGERQERLRENLARASGPRIVRATGDVRAPPSSWIVVADAADGRRPELPDRYDAVLVDAPCTNTGVMRHRIDVKWRLQEADFRRHAAQQRELLAAAARRVRPGGRLVYSTCSLDPEENDDVARAFAKAFGGEFTRVESRLAKPWTDGHDGAAVFSFVRNRAG